MKTIEIQPRGTVPAFINSAITGFDKKEATRQNLQNLVSEIEFFVLSSKDAHGNFNGKTGWVAPRNGANDWAIEINIITKP